MKKIFALAISMILLISILIPGVSSIILIPDNSTNYTELNDYPSSPVLICETEDPISLEKTIKDGENWVNTYNTDSGEIIRFRIKVTYHDWDGDPNTSECMLKNITIIDRLPSGLIYIGNSNYNETSISPDEKFIIWQFKDTTLFDNESMIIEFDAIGNNMGEFVNHADITAYESCQGKYRCNSTYATVLISNSNNNSTHATKYIDVDDDINDEKAIDENDDLSDGYEVYEDPDNSSDSIKSIDGDFDDQIDHFIDVDNDGLPDRYWDPDNDILTDIYLIDVDYDGTYEWVYDSDDDFDGIPDKYYDPDDDQIHEYIVYELTINIIGNGIVQKNPNGLVFLKDFNVTLNAVTVTGWEFDSWNGDLTGSTNPINITIDANKNITATFIQTGIFYTLTININGNGNVNPPTGNKYLEGTIVDVRATPDAGWKFTKWTGDLTGSTNPTTITMNSDKEITAVFTSIVSVNITKPENNHFYFFDIGFKSTEYKPQIIGPINVKVQVESEKGIAKVELYINNELKKTDDSAPYSWIWFLKPGGDEENYTITVKAYDLEGNTNTDSISVIRSEFNPIINHKKLIFWLGIISVALALLRNKGSESDVIPVEPDDNDSYDLNRPPVIDFGGPYTGIVGEPVYFDASGSHDPDGDLLSFKWDFGDGSIGSGSKLSHTYEKIGKYLIKLNVTDSEGNYDTETIEVVITDGSKTIGLDKDNWFWYIVTGLAFAITIAVGLLYIGGKRYV